MIIETMNEKELTNAIISDYNLILEKYFHRLADKYHKTRLRNKISKANSYPKIYEFRTPKKNNWMLFYQKAPSDEHYKDQNSIVVLFMVYYYNKIGLRVFKVEKTKRISVFNSHFFNRYNERLNLDLVDPLEKVKHFFNYNGYAYYQIIKKNGKELIFGSVKDGFVLGELQTETWAVFKTFITKNMAKGSQNEMEKELFEELENEIELNRDNSTKNEYLYLADILSGMSKSLSKD